MATGHRAQNFVPGWSKWCRTATGYEKNMYGGTSLFLSERPDKPQRLLDQAIKLSKALAEGDFEKFDRLWR